MCIVIDINSFPSVFNKKDTLHPVFEPIFNAFKSQMISMVYGGTQYRKELRKLSSLQML